MRKLIVRFANWLISCYEPFEEPEEPLPKTLEVRRYGHPPINATPIGVSGLTIVFRDDKGQFVAPIDEALDRHNWGRWWRHLGGSAFTEDGAPYDPSE